MLPVFVQKCARLSQTSLSRVVLKGESMVVVRQLLTRNRSRGAGSVRRLSIEAIRYAARWGIPIQFNPQGVISGTTSIEPADMKYPSSHGILMEEQGRWGLPFRHYGKRRIRESEYQEHFIWSGKSIETTKTMHVLVATVYELWLPRGANELKVRVAEGAHNKVCFRHAGILRMASAPGGFYG